VAPNGKNAFLGSFYTNTPVTGNWEDYILRDVIGYIDANYRTLARPESRGIAGHSMGGYGALVLGMRHPETFSALYALSPCCTTPEGDIGPDNPAWLKVLQLKSRDELKGPPASFTDFFVRAFIGMTVAFSPNAEKAPLYLDLPYVERNGRIERNESVYPKWASKFAVNMIDENTQNLRKLRGIFIDYGEKEEFTHIRIGARLVSSALAERNIPHIFEVYAGGTHGNKVGERLETRVFQFFSARLDFGS
jgi:S-formylglutathione hydrolase FrmB